MFALILTLVATILHLYLSWHVASLRCFNARGRRRFWVASLTIWLIYSGAIQLGHGVTHGVLARLEQLALDWLGVLFIASTVLLALDLVTAFGALARPHRNTLRTGALSLAAALVVVALLQGGRPPVVVRHEVASPTLPVALDGTRVVMISDLHLGSQLGERWLSARVDQVMALRPDMIVLLGDLFEGHGTPAPSLQPILSRLQAPLGVYAVTGNHEFHGESDAAIAMSEAAGIEWLRNRAQVAAPGLTLLGVDDLSRHERRAEGAPAEQLRPLLAHARDGVTILLSHSPLQAQQAAAAGVTLMLSGHTHGGQIWPFGYLVQRLYPYLAGDYRIGGMTLIVGRGTGLWGPRMRLWHPGEIIEVTLRRE